MTFSESGVEAERRPQISSSGQRSKKYSGRGRDAHWSSGKRRVDRGRGCARRRAEDQRLPLATTRSRFEVDEVEVVMQRAVGCGSAGSIEWMAHFLVDRGLKQKKRCWISCGEGGVGEMV